MSKTRGNVMDPFPLIDQYGADPFRFYCLREVSFGQDGDVSEEGFKARYNSELANELGNLLSRTASMIGKYRGGASRRCRQGLGHWRRWRPRARRWCGGAAAHYDAAEVTAAVERIWD